MTSFMREERHGSILTVVCSVGDAYQCVDVLSPSQLTLLLPRTPSFSLPEEKPSLLVLRWWFPVTQAKCKAEIEGFLLIYFCAAVREEGTGGLTVRL